MNNFIEELLSIESDLTKDLLLIKEKELVQDAIWKRHGRLDVGEMVSRYEAVHLPPVTCGLIILNEEERIARCLKGISNQFDEIIVLDAYSKDRTVPIIKSEFPEVKLIQKVWQNDFSLQRNHLLDHVTNDWVYFIDADNVFNEGNGRKLQRVAKLMEFAGITAVMSPVIHEHNGSISQDNRRFFKCSDGIRFKGMVHEEPVLPGGQIPLGFEMDVHISHDGYDEANQDQSERRRRNWLLTKKMAEIESSDPKWRYFLARDYLLYHENPDMAWVLDQLQKGIQLYEESGHTRYKLSNYLLQMDVLMRIGEVALAEQTLGIIEEEYSGLVDIHYYRTMLIMEDFRSKMHGYLSDTWTQATGPESGRSVISSDKRHIEELYQRTADLLNLPLQFNILPKEKRGRE
ncbi:SunS family peptide S-glycosyltransferase [Bacillus ectoiniformans]|uniref:glycosyltransferase n=1 Tax=Bacillus ectoiniformans TaxID=1494429 RepID=UPI0019594597|nr:glycosyltransferase [Bacillus ectoiniformans]MBM7650424.1 SunS family peptide S-glycosyltransferase [Bacillus ectoiniformans]